MSTNVATQNKSNTAGMSKVRFITQVGMLGAIAVILMAFEIPLPFAPAFYKIDFSEVPALIGCFAMGPASVAMIDLIKFVLHLLKKDVQEVDDFLKSIGDLKKNIKECRRCHNISDGEICEICSDPKRDNTTLCVVENIKDILSIEATSQYNGVYHVLGGIISPMDGIGPADLHITSLVERVEQEPIREIIFALSATIEGDTTGYYIFKKMKNKEDLVISTIAKGISIGYDLEYTDELS